MKLVKFVPAIAATLVLAACSTAGSVVSSATDAVSNAAGAVGNTVSSAASATTNAVSGAATAVKDTATGMVTKTQDVLPTKSKSVVYACQNNTKVTATYAFHNEEVKGANLKVGKTALNGFVVNPELSKKIDSIAFTSGAYSFVVENGLTLSNAEKVTAVMLTKHGKTSDQIVAKNCNVDAKATAALNK